MSINCSQKKRLFTFQYSECTEKPGELGQVHDDIESHWNGLKRSIMLAAEEALLRMSREVTGLMRSVKK